MYSKVLLSLASLVVIASSCGKEREVKKAASNEEKAPDLQADWKGYCEDAGFLPLSASVEVEFNPLNFKRSIFLSKDGSCTTRDIEVVYEGEYSIGDATDAQNAIHAKPVDLTYKTVKMKALTDSGVDALKLADFCGEKEWAVNEEKDLSAKSRETGCVLIDLPEVQYDIVSTEGGIVQFGETGIKSANTNVDARATKLNGTSLTKK